MSTTEQIRAAMTQLANARETLNIARGRSLAIEEQIALLSNHRAEVSAEVEAAAALVAAATQAVLELQASQV